MTNAVFMIKKGDTLPSLIAKFDGMPDLTNATIVFNLKNSATGQMAVSRGTATFYGAATDGVGEYDWQPGDTATAGMFEGEFEVTFPSGGVATYPNVGFIPVRINDDLG